MRKTAKLCLIPLLVSVLMLTLYVSVARASDRSFVIGSMEEAVEKVNLGVSDQVFGNISVLNGSIDFFITDPNGVTVQSFPNVSSTSFNLTASENGMYSMHLNNTYQAPNVTVELDYGLSMTFVAQAGFNVGSSTGVAHVVAPLPPPPPPPDPPDEPDNLVEQYLNLLRASDILNTARNARTILPIRNVTLMNCIASVLGLMIILNPRWRRSDFQAHARHFLASLR